MTLNGARTSGLSWAGPPAPALDPLEALAEAARVARAASHSRRLDTATRDALQALVMFAAATVALARDQARETGALRSTIRTTGMIGRDSE